MTDLAVPYTDHRIYPGKLWYHTWPTVGKCHICHAYTAYLSHSEDTFECDTHQD